MGERRLLVRLYGPPLLHVDLKFVSLDDAHERIEDPVILWEVDGRLSAAFARAEARYPSADPAWIEERFWIWANYLADKMERGEILEALDGLGVLRALVLAPLAFRRAGVQASRVRRIESRGFAVGSGSPAPGRRPSVPESTPPTCCERWVYLAPREAS